MDTLLALLLAAPAAAQGSIEAQEWPARFENPEPTPEETLLLVLVNRFRADPVGVAKSVRAAPDLLGRETYPELDWQMFEDECRALAPSPPLVHELVLARPARSHALYTLANNHWGHEEREGGAHFTGRWPAARLLAAGVSFKALENAGTGRPGPWSMLAGLVLDDGPGGPGGMQAGRGHRRTLHDPRARVACAGIVLRPRVSPFTFYVGEIDARFLGGVAFVDLDADGTYDVDEGLDGVVVRSGRAAIGTTWRSGGYGIRLPDDSARSLVFTYRGIEVEAQLGRGTENAVIDVEVSDQFAAAYEKRVAPLERSLAAGEAPSRKALLELLFLVDGAPLPEPVALHLSAWTGRMEEPWGEVQRELRDLRQRTLAAIDAADARALREVIREAKRALRGAPQLAWFELADDIGQAATKLANISAAGRRDAAARTLRNDLLPRTFAADLRERVRRL